MVLCGSGAEMVSNKSGVTVVRRGSNSIQYQSLGDARRDHTVCFGSGIETEIAENGAVVGGKTYLNGSGVMLVRH